MSTLSGLPRATRRTSLPAQVEAQGGHATIARTFAPALSGALFLFMFTLNRSTPRAGYQKNENDLPEVKAFAFSYVP